MRTLLTALLTSPVMADPKPLGASLWRKARDLVRDAADAAPLEAWAGRLGPREGDLVRRRLSLLDEMERLLAALSGEGIEVVTEFDNAYPQRLLERLRGGHPAMLFVMGARHLLNADSVGVVGSRDIDDEARAFARRISAEAVAEGLAVVSGGARGTDLEAMRGALDAGGMTVGFLADAMVKLAARPQMRQLLDEGRVCLATPTSPTAAFQVGTAMARNKYIYASSLATVVVSSAAETGGTWAGATDALRMKLCPVLVRTGPHVPDGNPRLVARGAVPLASASELSAVLRREVARRGSAPEQGMLF